MRPIVFALAALISMPADAATVYGTYWSYGPAKWAGYFDGTGGAFLSLILKDNLPIGATRSISLADLASVNLNWYATLRLSHIGGNVYRSQSWQALSPDITSFSATVRTVPGRMELLSASITTSFVQPWNGDAGVGATALEFTEGSYHFWNANGASYGQVMSNTPEPAAWALMLAGFGIVGATLRQARPARQRFADCRAYPI